MPNIGFGLNGRRLGEEYICHRDQTPQNKTESLAASLKGINQSKTQITKEEMHQLLTQYEESMDQEIEDSPDLLNE